MQAYDNMSKDPELAAQMLQMSQNHVTLRVSVADTLPPNAHGDARATITFTPVAGDFEGKNEYVMPNSQVEIVVKASAIRNDLTWEDTFKGILAHELTHLKRDANGRYLDDHVGDGYTGEKTYDTDDETHGNLFGSNSLANYFESQDITRSVDHFGFAIFSGTNGNNTINMRGTDAFAAYTGGGNDLVFGSAEMNVFYVDGEGKKAIIEFGTVYDMVVMEEIPTASMIVLTYIGADLYITSSASPYAPINDPNAVVIVGQTLGSSQNAVELVSAADFTSIDVYDSSSPTARTQDVVPFIDGSAGLLDKLYLGHGSTAPESERGEVLVSGVQRVRGCGVIFRGWSMVGLGNLYSYCPVPCPGTAMLFAIAAGATSCETSKIDARSLDETAQVVLIRVTISGSPSSDRSKARPACGSRRSSSSLLSRAIRRLSS